MLLQKNPLKIEITRSRKNKNYYWHAKRSGRIIACGAEGYKSKAKLVKTLNKLLSTIFSLQYKVIDLTPKW